MKGKLVGHWRHVCRNCSFTVKGVNKHECFKRFGNYCNKKQLSCHFFYAAPLKPSKLTDGFMNVFFDTDCTQDFEKHDGYFERIPNVICAQQFVKRW